MTTLALAPVGVLARCAIARAFEMHITFPACAAFAQQKLLTIAGEIGDRLICHMCHMGRMGNIFSSSTPHNRPPRHLPHLVWRILAIHFFPTTVPAVFRLNNGFVEKMSEMVGMLIRPQDNIATASTVTTIRPAFGNEFLAPETDTPPSTLSGLCKNFDAIDKHDA